LACLHWLFVNKFNSIQFNFITNKDRSRQNWRISSIVEP